MKSAHAAPSVPDLQYICTCVLWHTGDEVVELNGELLSGLSDEVLQEIVHSAELGGGEVELVIRLQ